MNSAERSAEIPFWTNQDLVLYHGTDEQGADSIREHQVSLDFSKIAVDFGRGFYKTTSRDQARQWATMRSMKSGTRPAVLRITVQRAAIAALDVLAFVRGTFDAVDFWSLVNHCRSGGGEHHKLGWYDIVVGPVTLATFPRRRILRNSDQMSFHTDKALTILNKAVHEFERLW